MKKIFLFILPFSLFAVDLHPLEECETFKNTLIQGVQSAYSHSESIDIASSQLSNDIQFNLESNQALENYANTSSSMNATDKSSVASVARSNINMLNQMESQLLTITINNSHVRDELFSISNLLSSVNCTACSVDSSGTNCCDFTSIEQRLDQQIDILDNIDIYIDYIAGVQDEIFQLLSDFRSGVYTGFGSVTNSLNTFLIFSTNRFINSYLDVSKLPVSTFPGSSTINYGMYYRSRAKSQGWNTIAPYGNNNYQPSSPLTLSRAAYAIQNTIPQALVSLNNAAYWRTKELDEPITNFFTFFRGEIGVQGVLKDWTNEEADGTYHDFLTNHYIHVVRDGSLSAFSYEKTNWFARVETLLAALVFQDEVTSSGTNLVDSTRYDSEKQQINDLLQDSISYLGVPVGKLQEMTDPMVSQLTVFSDAFSSAILPSHITLFSIGDGVSRSSSTTPFDVTFLVDSDQQAYYNIIRSCTTLCWVFVSLLLIYWFLVWTINKVIVIIRFFWNVAEMFMSRNG